MNDILRHLSAHRSVRKYLPTPVPDEHIRRAVAAAQMAATSSWIQAYCLIQVTDPSRRATLAELTGGQEQVERAGAFFCVSGDVRRHRLIAERAGQPYEANLEVFLLAVIDATLFAQNLTLAFESMGYGCCYIGGLRTRLPEVDELLGFPEGVFPLFGLCVGEPADVPGQRPRLPVEAVWVKDEYPSDGRMLGLVAEFDRVAGEHYEGRGLAGRNWSGGTWRKFAKRVREHLLDYYRSKGAVFE